MNGSKTVIILIIVFVVALFLGFLMGSKRVSDVKRELTESETRCAAFEAERSKAIAQKELAMCKWELVQTQTNTSRRDFGRATEAFDVAVAAFSSARSASTPEFAEKLTPLKGAFDEIQVGLDENDVKIAGRLAELINHIDILLSQ